MGKRPMPPALKAYWAAKRAKKSGSAPRKSPVSKTKSAVKRAASNLRSRSRASARPAIDGGLAALASRAATRLSPTYGPGAGMAAVGVVRKNDALTTLGVMSVVGRAIDSAKVPGLPAGAGSGI